MDYSNVSNYLYIILFTSPRMMLSRVEFSFYGQIFCLLGAKCVARSKQNQVNDYKEDPLQHHEKKTTG